MQPAKAAETLQQILDENKTLNQSKKQALSRAIDAMEFLDAIGRTQTPSTREEALAVVRELIAKLEKVAVQTEKIGVQ